MADQEFGVRLTTTLKSVAQVYRDLRSFYRSVESELREKGWLLAKSTVTKEDDWVPPAEFFYLFAPNIHEFSTAVMIYLNLAPPGPLNQPYLLIGKADFDSSIAVNEVWNNWWGPDSLQVLKQCLDCLEPLELPENLRKPQYAPRATKAVAFAVPLCDIKGLEELKRRVIAGIPKIADSMKTSR